jgi:hypothetical protein
VTKPLWIPGAIRKPIPNPGGHDPTIIPVGDIFHVAVFEGLSLHDFFERDGGIESTGYIRRDGTIEQYRPLNVECDAQNDGNSWVGGGKRYGFNSWETQGMGAGEWTPAQMASIKQIIAFKHTEYGTPLRVCPDWNQPGFGYHALFGRWNKSNHSCPGADRIKQFNSDIVPWMNQGGSEDDVTPDDIAKIAQAVLDAKIDNKDPNKGVVGQISLGEMVTKIERDRNANGARFRSIEALLTALAKKLDTPK